ncbi:hypothetical protein GCM10007874_29520 [Labrys miyagiensis]|uniref:Uncharacterized protein n=1 Tax=Labrys miyagiensis TaxID=346912 RepID=A0ABQ6CJ65_9HYPH|nr:hypothetical protein GCM10007874_29520 [Labrys miyagiensis]
MRDSVTICAKAIAARPSMAMLVHRIAEKAAWRIVMILLAIERSSRRGPGADRQFWAVFCVPAWPVLNRAGAMRETISSEPSGVRWP